MAKPSRRGKSDKSTIKSETTNTAEEQIQRAQAAVEQSRIQAATLHSKWRQHLMRLSYMVVLITIHQLQAPATYCLYDIKSYNDSLTPLDDSSLRISGYRAIYYIVRDALCEFCAVIMGILLTVFLIQQYNAGSVILVNSAQQQESFLTNKAYMISTGFVPPVLNFYFHRSKANVSSCLEHSSVTILTDRMWTRHAEQDDSLASAVRGFPVVIVFHTIATICCWFMEMQQSQQQKNINMIEALKRDLATARAENAAKKKS